MNKLAFIGAGSMSEAMISGILNSGFSRQEQIFVTNKNNRQRLAYLQEMYNIQCCVKKEDALVDADIVILATKPYDMKEAIAEVKPYLHPGQLIISVIAGISTDTISRLIGNNGAVIRAMPNTSASIGFSATAISAGKFATKEHVQLAESLFKTIGTTVIVKEEAMHTVTSISGSGPAYIYYLVEAMEKAALDAGLDLEVAKTLISQTVIGAGEMLKSSGEPANVLRKKITSAKGTTEAGIETLNKYNFQKAVIECVKSANARSIELGKMG